jgi:thioester reductase-like protein
MVLSVMATGIAPGSFYRLDAAGAHRRPRGVVAALWGRPAWAAYRQRQHSVLQMLQLRNSSYVQAAEPTRGWLAPTDRFRAALQDAKIGRDRSDPGIPHISAPIIIKYVTDLQLLGLL